MGRNDEIEISAELRQERAESFAVWQGDMDHDSRGGEREKWIFLPKSLCKKGDEPNTWLVPEWLAQEKGLI